MKRSLLIVLSATAILSSGAFAATSGTLNLSGTVAEDTSIVINPLAKAINLDIVNGESNTTIGAALETSNRLLGYRIMMSSTNAGELRHGTVAGAKTTYKIRYNGAAAGVTPGPTATPVEVKNLSLIHI